MDYIETLNSNRIERAWATIGAFDGVHTGHRALFARLSAGAHAAGCKAVALTFDPLPALFFNRIQTGQMLCSLKERLTLIKNSGIDEIIVLDFTRELAGIEAPDFLQELKKAIGLECLLTGFNFTLGKDQKGSVPVLMEIGREHGFKVEVVQPVRSGKEIISSSNIRNLLKAGEIARANEYLGSPYTLTGRVVHGEHRGGKLGIPTANLSIPRERLLPVNGVYASVAHINRRSFLAVTNIGIRPTFENPLPAPRVEPHLLDTDEHFYGKTIRLELREYLRPEVKFLNAQALVEQIHKDIQKTRELIADEA